MQKNCIETFSKSRSKDEILKIYGIYRTNCFENGVAINFARFNHSCCSNAEQMVNEGDLYLMPRNLTLKIWRLKIWHLKLWCLKFCSSTIWLSKLWSAKSIQILELSLMYNSLHSLHFIFLQWVMFFLSGKDLWKKIGKMIQWWSFFWKVLIGVI